MTAKTRSLKAVTKATNAAILREEEDQLAHRAYELRRAGKSYWTIAEELKLPEARVAALVDRAITAAADLVSNAARHKLLTLEIERLDDLMAAHWPAATSPVIRLDNQGNQVTEPPDVRAGEFVLKVIAARTKLQGLDTADATTTASFNTVVVTGNEEEYIRALKMVAAPRTIEGETADASA